MKLIKNAEIWTMAGQDYQNGNILIDNERIVEVGENITPPIDVEIIDAHGMIVMPGMIDAHCHLGMFGEGTGSYLLDGNEMTNPSTPYLRAIDSINPQDMAFHEAVEGGVTTVCTGPGSTNVFAGTFAIVKTYGKSVEEMTVIKDYALKSAFGENPKRIYSARKQTPASRMGTAAVFRTEMNRAREYMNKLDKSSDEAYKAPEYDFYLENLVKVLKHEIPLKIHAHRMDDICTAMRLVKEFDIECTLDHCTEGYKMPEMLKEFGSGLIVGPIILDRCKVELGESRSDNVVAIAKSGSRFCIATDSPCTNVKHLSVSAGYAVGLGLDEKEALKALTIYPAEILNIADRVGSIEVGKDADLVFLTGHLFDMESKIARVMINGLTVYKNVE